MRYLSHNIYHVDYGLFRFCSRWVFGGLAVATFGFVTLHRFLSHNIQSVDYSLIALCSRAVLGSFVVATFTLLTLYVFLFWSFLALL